MKTPSSRTKFWGILTGLLLAGPPALLFVVLVAALAIPQSLRIRKSANETSALQTMRILGGTELSYNASYPAQGYACSLQSLGGDPKAGPPSPAAAQIIDPALASTGRKSGYTFTIACGKKLRVDQREISTGYHIYAVPDSIGRTGDNGYCADEANIIHVDPAGFTNCTRQFTAFGTNRP